MPSKILIYQEEARRAMEQGVNKVANAVKVTLGPKGRNVVIESDWGGNPIVTKDGVTVAKAVELKDPYENLGAQLCKQVASKTNDVAGDGTTTATVLAQAIVNNGLRYLAAGGNAVSVKRGIDRAVEQASELVRGYATPVESRDQIEYVATISGNDPEVGSLIAEAMEKVGRDGVITLEESRGRETTLSLVEGMEFDRGYISQHFVTNIERMRVELDDPFILLVDRPLVSGQECLPIIEQVAKQRRPLVVIAENVDGELLASLVVNKLKGTFSSVAVKAPGFGERRKEMLEDLAVLTGGTVISHSKGIPLESATLDHLGQAKRVIVSKDTCTIVDGNSDEDAVQQRIAQLRHLLSETESQYEKESLETRLGKLSGGIAVIKVGGSTEAEMKERKYRYEDAINATRAAVEEGVVVGGGVTLLRIADQLSDVDHGDVDVNTGYAIMKRALEEPLRQIAANAGMSGDVVIARVRDAAEGEGMDARTGEIVAMHESGIIDPAKVTLSAVQNAASIAGLVLTTETLIVADPEDKQPAIGEGMMPGMGM